MLTSPYSVAPSAPTRYVCSECVYRSLTLVAMALLLATLWVF